MDDKKHRSSLRRTINKDEDDVPESRGRRISFHGKKFVRTFLDDVATKHWDNSYEISDHINAEDSSASGNTIGGNITNNEHKQPTQHAIVNQQSINLQDIDRTQDHMTLHHENSINFTLLPQEIMQLKPVHLNNNMLNTYLEQNELLNVQKLKCSREAFEKTFEFMKESSPTYDEPKAQGHTTNASMATGTPQQTMVMYEDISVMNTSQPIAEVHNRHAQMTHVYNDDMHLDTTELASQETNSVEHKENQKPKVIVRTICTNSTTLGTEEDLDKKRLKRYQCKQEMLQQQQKQPNSLEENTNLLAQNGSDKYVVFDFSAANSSSNSTGILSNFNSPLIPIDCVAISGTNKVKLNLRQLNDEIEQGRVQIFPGGPKTPTTDRKSKQHQHWYANTIDIDAVLKPSSKLNFGDDIERSNSGGQYTKLPANVRSSQKKHSYRYSQADELLLDNTNFLTQAKLGDESQSRSNSKYSDRRETTYRPVALDLDKSLNVEITKCSTKPMDTLHFDNEDMMQDKVESHLPNNNEMHLLPKSRKTLHFESFKIDEATTTHPCIPSNDAAKKKRRGTILFGNHENQISIDETAGIAVLEQTVDSFELELKKVQKSILPSFEVDAENFQTPKKTRSRNSHFAITPGRSMIEFEDIEQECNDVSLQQNIVQENINSACGPALSVNTPPTTDNINARERDITGTQNIEIIAHDASCEVPQTQQHVDISQHSTDVPGNSQIKARRTILEAVAIADDTIITDVPTDRKEDDFGWINMDAVATTVKKKLNRQTVFEGDDMEIDDDGRVNNLNAERCHKRQTTYNWDDMMTESTEPQTIERVSAEKPESTQCTGINTDETKSVANLPPQPKARKRVTILDSNPIVIEVGEEATGRSASARPTPRKRRQTSYKTVEIVSEVEMNAMTTAGAETGQQDDIQLLESSTMELTLHDNAQSTQANEKVSSEHLDDSSGKRLPVHLTPNFPTSKKRQTIHYENHSLEVDSFHCSGNFPSIHKEKLNTPTKCCESILNIVMNNESPDEHCLTTKSNRQLSASRIPVLLVRSPGYRSPCSTSKKVEQTFCDVDESVQMPRRRQTRRSYDIITDNWQVDPLNVDKIADISHEQHIVPIFEGNPITISDVTAHFEEQRKSQGKATTTTASNPNTPPRWSSGDSHDNGFRSIARLNAQFLDITSDGSLLENTHINLVESLICNDEDEDEDKDDVVVVDDVDNVADEHEHCISVKPEPKSIVENLKEICAEPNIIKTATHPRRASICRTCRRCAGTFSDTASTMESFVLPQLPTEPCASLERLRRLRAQPSISDVHKYFDQKLLQDENASVFVNDNDLSPRHKEIQEFNVDDFIADIRKSTLSVARESQECPAAPLKLSFVERLDNQLTVHCPNWIFDYQMQSRNEYIFSHRKCVTLRITMDFVEKDDLGMHINVTHLHHTSHRLLKAKWLPFHHMLDYQLKIKLASVLQSFPNSDNEDKVFSFLQNIDLKCMETLTACNQLWHIVTMQQASLVRDANRTFVSKTIRRIVSNEDAYPYVAKEEFLIEIVNITNISYEDIVKPKLYLFNDDVQYIPKGLDFLRAFLPEPTTHLRNWPPQ